MTEIYETMQVIDDRPSTRRQSIATVIRMSAVE